MLAYFPIARRLKLFDIPNERSSHSSITFRGGGVLFPSTLLLYGIFFNFNLKFMILGVLLSSIVSFYDDLKGSNAFFRLICHFISVAFIMEEMPKNPDLSSPYIIILIAIVAVAAVNAYNFMDGINAITGLYTLSIYETILFYDYKIENVFSEELLAVMTIAILIFGFYNFRTRAVLFAGDIGSVSLGLLSVYFVLFLIFKNSSIIYLSMVAVYGVESGLTIMYRLIKRQNIFQAHRMHLFQDLVNIKKIPHIKVSIYYTLLQLIINLGMFISLINGYPGYYYFAYVVILLIGLYIILKYQIHTSLNKAQNEVD